MGQVGSRGVACCTTPRSWDDHSSNNTPRYDRPCEPRTGSDPPAQLNAAAKKRTERAETSTLGDQFGRPKCCAAASRTCPSQLQREDLCLAQALAEAEHASTTDVDTGGTVPALTLTEGRHPRDIRDCSAQGLTTRFDPFSNLMGAGDRPADQGGNLFGDRALRPKILHLANLKEEVKALEQTAQQLSRRLAPLESEPGAVVVAPKAFEAACLNSSALRLSEWVQQLLSHEEALRGVPARSVKEACSEVFGSTSRLIGLTEVKSNYAAILQVAGRLTDDRITAVASELGKLEQEVGEIEDIVALCFEKLDVAGNGVVTRKQFMSFVCGEGDENLPASCAVSASDANSLFSRMLPKGREELDFDSFRGELTHGCLQILRGNIALRRSMLKRYRDYWF